MKRKHVESTSLEYVILKQSTLPVNVKMELKYNDCLYKGDEVWICPSLIQRNPVVAEFVATIPSLTLTFFSEENTRKKKK